MRLLLFNFQTTSSLIGDSLCMSSLWSRVSLWLPDVWWWEWMNSLFNPVSIQKLFWELNTLREMFFTPMMMKSQFLKWFGDQIIPQFHPHSNPSVLSNKASWLSVHRDADVIEGALYVCSLCTWTFCYWTLALLPLPLRTGIRDYIAKSCRWL